MPDGDSDLGLTLEIPTAEVFLPLLEPARYKGLRGGRGGAKSHMVAERLLEDAAFGHHRIACLREFQSSIAASSKQLLDDKIKQFGLEAEFQSTQTEIRGPYDSLFIFKGLDGSSADSLKSLEGYSRAWVEEAQTITARSLELMTPTFRRAPGMIDNPEMYFSWNPISESDPVDSLFAENTPEKTKHLWRGPGYICTLSSYKDNPWFPDDLREDMLRDRRRDPERYAHVWLGEYRQHSQARIFHNYTVEEFETPANARFFLGADWGFGDPSVLTRCWLYGKTLYIDYEAYRVNCPIDELPALFDTIPGARKWPIRADSARPETIHYMKTHGFPNMTESVKGKGSVEDGIEFLKSYDIKIHPRCEYTIDEFSTYSYKVDKKTLEILPVIADKNNHCIDSVRYSVEGERLAAKPVIITQRMKQWARVPYRRKFRLG